MNIQKKKKNEHQKLCLVKSIKNKIFITNEINKTKNNETQMRTSIRKYTKYREKRQLWNKEHWPVMLNLGFNVLHILTKIGKIFIGLYVWLNKLSYLQGHACETD